MNAVGDDNLGPFVQCANIVEPHWTEKEDFEKVIRCKVVRANAGKVTKLLCSKSVL